MADNEQPMNVPEESQLPSPGQVLRQAREKLGLSQQDIADKLFLKVAIIDNLENDVLDENTSITFIKGYVKLYAKHVGVAEQTIVAQFDQRHAGPKSTTRLQSFSKSVTRQANDARWMMVTYAILALVVAGVVVWFIQQPSNPALIESTETSDAAATSSQAQVPTQPSQSQAQELPSQLQTQQRVRPQDGSYTSQRVSSNELTTESASSSDEATVSPAETAEQITNQIENNPNQQNASKPNDSRVNDANTTDTKTQPVSNNSSSGLTELVFTFSEDCWVNIEDATGEAIAYGVKRAGRVMTIQGQPPFAVTLGNPTQVAITYAGDSVDLSGFDGGQIARFSLPIQD